MTASVLRKCVAVDSSLLINFLSVDRLDLLRAVPETEWIVTEHVRTELTDAEQMRRYESGVTAGILRETRVDALQELATFSTLLRLGLGIGESATIAVAVHREWGVAIDDAAAIRKAKKHHPNVLVIKTEDIVRSAIVATALSLQEADSIKTKWEQQFRFRLAFTSFAAVLDEGT